MGAGREGEGLESLTIILTLLRKLIVTRSISFAIAEVDGSGVAFQNGASYLTRPLSVGRIQHFQREGVKLLTRLAVSLSKVCIIMQNNAKRQSACKMLLLFFISTFQFGIKYTTLNTLFIEFVISY